MSVNVHWDHLMQKNIVLKNKCSLVIWNFMVLCDFKEWGIHTKILISKQHLILDY